MLLSKVDFIQASINYFIDGELPGTEEPVDMAFQILKHCNMKNLFQTDRGKMIFDNDMLEMTPEDIEDFQHFLYFDSADEKFMTKEHKIEHIKKAQKI